MILKFELPILYTQNYEEIENAEEGENIKEVLDSYKTMFRVDMDKVRMVTINPNGKTTTMRIDEESYMIDADYETVKLALKDLFEWQT